jgi:small-conductance mechanosensitive channel
MLLSPQPNRSKTISIVVQILYLISFFCTAAVGQSPVQLVGDDTSKTAKVIEPIALTNIGIETEKTVSKIRTIRNALETSGLELGLDSIIPLRLKDIDRLKKNLDLSEIEEMGLRETQNLKNDFSQQQIQLNGWRSGVTKRAEELGLLREELGEIKTQWEKTLNLKRDEKLPRQIIERVQTNLEEINTLYGELTRRTNDLLTKQTELTDALLFIDEVLNAITKSELVMRQEILIIDSPPIWHMFGNKSDTLTFIQKFTKAIQVQNQDVKTFQKNFKTKIYYHLLLFVFLFFALLYLKNDIKKWSDERKDEAIRYSLFVILHPFSAALLISVLVTGLFFKDAPGDILNYYRVLLCWPMLVLLPGLIKSIEKKYFYYIAAVFIVIQFAEYFSDMVILERLLLLLMDTLTIVIIVSLLKRRRDLEQKDPKYNWRVTFAVLRLSVFLLSASVLANILGNTNIAKILSGGSLTMVYGGLIVFVSGLILKSLFSLIMQHEHISRLNIVQNYSDDIKHKIFRFIRVAAVIFWVYLTLTGYTIYEPVYGWLKDFLTREWQIGSLVISLGSILAFFVTLWISLSFSKFIRFLLQDEVLTHFEMPRGVPGAISMIVRLVLIFIGFIMAFGAAKIDLSNMAIIFGALGVGIGFGLQNIFNNLVSGLILIFERPIQVGDIIQIGNLNLMGEVKEIGIRASTVRTFDGAEVIVPNGNLISNEMINWTLSDHRRRQELIVGVAYGTDTNRVLEILKEILQEQENVLKNPSPSVFFLGFGESSLDFRVLFWTHFDNGLGTKSAVGIAIDEAFKKAGIEIPFPQRDLHLRSVSETVEFSKEKRADLPKKTKGSTS